MDEDVTFTYDSVYPDEDVTQILSLLPPPMVDTEPVNSDYGSDAEHEPISITIEESIPEPIVEPIVEPVVEPIVEPVIEPVVEPVVEPVIEPVVEPVIEPVVEPVIEPVVEHVIETVVEHIVESVIEPVVEPVLSIIEHKIIPKVIFIVPYRDRPEQLKIYKEKMQHIIGNNPIYRILVIHQCDTRAFNRGAIKNIGFLVVKQLYPNSYKNITLVFNDVDSVPKSSMFNYITKHSIIKHFFGFKNALGGILSITGNDFEKVNGFPNYWGWGYEDNMLQKRVLKHKMKIDRSIFEPLNSNKIDHNYNTHYRTVNRIDFKKYINNINDGIADIHNLEYTIENDMVNIFQFDTDVKYNPDIQETYDLRNGPIPFKDMIPSRRQPRMRMTFT